MTFKIGLVDTSRPWRSTQSLNGWTRDFNLQRFLIQSLYLQKTSGQGVRTHPPMVLLAMVREGDIDQLAFYWVSGGYLPLRVKVYIYGARDTVPLINGEEIFYVVMMT